MKFMNGRVSLFTSFMKKKWVVPLFASTLFVIFLLRSLNMGLISSMETINLFLSLLPSKISHENCASPVIVDFKLSSEPPTPAPDIPRLAYLISGSKGDLSQLWRTLHALYHPHNLYVVHLDLESPAAERRELAARVANHSLFAKVGNVYMITKANMVTYRGPTMVANTLHACAILLKKWKKWDWFINLSASDYPLVTQDDLLFAFSKLPRNLNFVEHTSRLRWKEAKRAKPSIIDPGLYMKNKSDVFWLLPKREVPNAFKLFTGSAWMALSREFVEFCIWGWDNLPRVLLMYYTNFISSPEGYFQTVICNSPDFNGTIVNHDLHYISWNIPPRQHPHTLYLKDFEKMIRSNAPFARKFDNDDPVLDKIDDELLHRLKQWVIPGGWCSGEPLCSDVADELRLKPGQGSEKLALLLDRLFSSDTFMINQCK